MTGHWIILPVILPALIAPLLLSMSRASPTLRRTVSAVGVVGLLIVATGLINTAETGTSHVYQLGNWPAPFGIVLVLDRLSALMVLLTAIVALASLLYAIQGWDRRGHNFHALLHFQLMGLNGAFLTGDLFNLFVFFEVLLIASYCLLLHGGRRDQLRFGTAYVVLNLTGSALFLISATLFYGIAGTLNMADLAVRLADPADADVGLLRAAALLLLIVFGVKAALVPLHFWLPGAYAATSAPVAALFAIMTKVGAYCIVRVYTLAFGPGDGPLALVADGWLLPAALATLAVGMVGAAGSRRLGQLVAFLVIASMGTVMTAFGLFTEPAIAAGLYYLIHSSLIGATLFLLVEVIAVQRGDDGDALHSASPVVQPALLGLLFLLAGIAVVGIPPLSGFIGKLSILQSAGPTPAVAWVWAVVLTTSLLALIGVGRAGNTLFWDTARPDAGDGDVQATFGVLAPIVLLLGAIAVTTVEAGPIFAYTEATAAQLMAPQQYIDAVLGADYQPGWRPPAAALDAPAH